MDSKSFALDSARFLDEKKAHDVVIIDIMEKSSFADYLVVATGGSERQINALVDDLTDKFERDEVLAKNIEGRHGTGWILMDYGDVIVNVFSQEMRDKYSIEKVWGDCKILEFEEK